TVFARKADAGESPFVQGLLQLPGSLPGLLGVAVEKRRLLGILARHVLGQPGPGPALKLLDRFSNHRRWPPAAPLLCNRPPMLSQYTTAISAPVGLSQ